MFHELELEQLYLEKKKAFEYALFLIRTKGYRKELISKKNGKKRELNIPKPYVKNLQHKVNLILQSLYQSPKPVHGFIKKSNQGTKNIVTNASQHINKYVVINIDIENFFDSINFGRVRGMFLSKPFSLPENIATRYAQLTTYKNKLPQGAPTSPIISNIISKRLDHNLIKLAKEYSLTYTRYADDLSFSTKKKNIDIDTVLILIEEIINDNGFKINPLKTRVQYSKHSQVVTGLKVNKKVNVNRKFIRQVRSMLYSWHILGLEEASNIHFTKFNKLKNKYQIEDIESFKRVLLGKINFIGQVKGQEDINYIRFKHTYYLLNDSFFLKNKCEEFEEFNINNLKKKEIMSVFLQILDSILIFTEGETDIMYIKAALKFFQEKNKYKDLRLRFCNLRGWVNVKNIHRILFEPFKESKDLPLINKRKCIFPYLQKNLKFCFVLDADDPAIIGYFGNKYKKNYYLIDQENKGYIEKLIDKDIVLKYINEIGYPIIPERAKEKTAKQLKAHLDSSSTLDEIFSIENYIVYKKKLIKKTDLAKKVVLDENVNFDNFENLLTFLEKMQHNNSYASHVCCTSMY